VDDDVRRAIAALDDDADPMHLDQTPAVHELARMGLRAVEPLATPLLSDDQDTRLHAQRAWEGIVYARHGFVSGQGFPDDDAEAAAIADLSAVGYSFEDGRPEREAAVRRLREWVERAER
jgi:hypothetical protein